MNALTGLMNAISATWRGHGRTDLAWLEQRGQLSLPGAVLAETWEKDCFYASRAGQSLAVPGKWSMWCWENPKAQPEPTWQAWCSLACTWISSHPPFPASHYPQMSPTHFLAGVSGTFFHQPCLIQLADTGYSSCPFCRWGN